MKRKAGSRRETWVLTAKGDALVRFRSGSYRWTKLEGLAANTSCLLLNVFDISGPLGLTGLLKKMSAEDKQYIYWAVFSKTLKTFLSYQSLGEKHSCNLLILKENLNCFVLYCVTCRTWESTVGTWA